MYESANDRVVTYDLDKLSEPAGRYTAANGSDQLDQLTPCGKDRV